MPAGAAAVRQAEFAGVQTETSAFGRRRHANGRMGAAFSRFL